MNDRLDELFLAHDLPVALFTYRQDPDGRSLSSWSPFCDYSPEWVTLHAAREVGATPLFVDLPALDPAFEGEQNRYSDRHVCASDCLGEACARLGFEDTDARWDHLFEQPIELASLRQKLAMDGADGATRWVRPGRDRPLHSTRIHGASSSLLIALGGQPGIFDFVDLLTGESKASISVPGSWGGTFSERPVGTSGDEALVVERDDASFTMVTGATPALTMVEVPETIASRNLQLVDGVIPYMTPGGELVAWSLAASRLLRLGAVHHNRLDMLPFAVLGDDLFVYGTSFGMLGLTSTTVGNRHARRISKRVSTMITTAKDAVIFGTAGGTVVAYAGLANTALHPPPTSVARVPSAGADER